MLPNGRVPDIKQPLAPQYARVSEDPKVAPNPYHKEALRGGFNINDVNVLFFSQQNIDALQQGIRYSVWKKSCEKHIIGNQSEDELKIIMRSIYLQHSKNLPYNIVEQVKELNTIVLGYCVPRILAELSMYESYLDRVSKLPDPMAYGTNESVKGTKVLETKDF